MSHTPTEFASLQSQLSEQLSKTDLLMTAIKNWLEVPFEARKTAQLIKAEKGILDAYETVKGAKIHDTNT